MQKMIEIPEMWEELSPRQFKYLLKSVFKMMKNNKITTDDVLRDFADYLLGRRKIVHPVRREEYLLLVNDVAETLNWIFKKETGKIIFNFETTQNLIPTLGNLIGPQSHGSDFRFGEYRTAVEYYTRYTQEHQPQMLDALVGILYRKPNRRKKNFQFNGSHRQPFNRYLIDEYAKQAKPVPEYLKWGVYLWFGNFCRYLFEGTFIIEGNEVSFASIFERSNVHSDEKKNPSLGMTAVLFSLADSGTFGTAKETDETELFKVLLKLLHDKNILDELKKKSK
jgi:hypothetical protein